MIIPSAAAIVFLNSNTAGGTSGSKSPLYTGSLTLSQQMTMFGA